LDGNARAGCAGLLAGIAPAHVPGVLPAVLQRLPENLPLPAVRVLCRFLSHDADT